MRSRIFIGTPEPGSTPMYKIVGALTDTVSCMIRCEYNTGVYQLDLQYVPGGIFSSMLAPGNAVISRPPFATGHQIFRIASVRRTLADVIAVTAYHISYLHSSEICGPFLNGGQAWNAAQAWAAAIAAIKNPIGGTKTCSITDTASGAFGVHLLQPKGFRETIYAQLIPAYGGQISYDNLNVLWSAESHPDRGVELTGGVNVIGCTISSDTSGFESGIYPFYGEEKSVESTYVDLGEPIVYGLDVPQRIIPMDFTSRFTAKPTAERLRAAAKKYAVQRAAEYHPYDITIERVPESIVVVPGDTVHINVKSLGIRTDRIATAVVYDGITGNINGIEVGDQKRNTLGKMLSGTK